jgi:iron (metal) dependent repressor, dtxR family protein
VELRVSAGGVRLVGPSGDPVVLADDIARHLFVRR